MKASTVWKIVGFGWAVLAVIDFALGRGEHLFMLDVIASTTSLIMAELIDG